jgi:hypothetical protein
MKFMTPLEHQPEDNISHNVIKCNSCKDSRIHTVVCPCGRDLKKYAEEIRCTS